MLTAFIFCFHVGFALDGFLTKGNTLLVMEIGKQKESKKPDADGAKPEKTPGKKDVNRAKITSVIDYYFYVENETMVRGETVLEVSW